MMPMETNTEKGIKYFNYGFLLYIIASALLLVILLAVLGTLSTLLADPESVEGEEFVGPLVGFLAGLCLGIVVIFIALILFLVGLISIYSGRMEFGEAHANSVQKGTVFLIVSVLVAIVIGLVGGLISQATGIFTSILTALGLVYLVLEVSDEKGKRMLWLAGIMYIVIGIVSAIVTIWLFTTYGLYDIGAEPDISAEEAANAALTAMMIAMGIGSIGLIPLIIFYLAYRSAYFRIKNREIQPMMAMPPGPYPGTYPPGYPYTPPPYPYQPPPSPPYQPPPSPPYQPPPQQVQPGGIASPVPSTGAPVQPRAVSPEQVGIKKCTFCGSQIPAGSTTCPVCKKEL